MLYESVPLNGERSSSCWDGRTSGCIENFYMGRFGSWKKLETRFYAKSKNGKWGG